MTVLVSLWDEMITQLTVNDAFDVHIKMQFAGNSKNSVGEVHALLLFYKSCNTKGAGAPNMILDPGRHKPSWELPTIHSAVQNTLHNNLDSRIKLWTDRPQPADKTLTFDLLTPKPNQIIFVPRCTVNKSLVYVHQCTPYHRYRWNNTTNGHMDAHMHGQMTQTKFIMPPVTPISAIDVKRLWNTWEILYNRDVNSNMR